MRPCSLKMLRMSQKISLVSLSAFTSLFFLSSSQYLTISRVSALYVTNLFLIDSRLSSERPLVSPLLRRRASMTSSPQSRWRMNGTSAVSFISFSHVERFSMLRGKPSIKNLPPFSPDFSMAFCNSITVISLGTILPSTMYRSMTSPNCDPGCLRSALSKSPADRWTNLKSL